MLGQLETECSNNSSSLHSTVNEKLLEVFFHNFS